MIVGRFGRESTLLKDGKYIKDLSYLNRPIKDIVYIDYSDDPV
jgi:TFIIF-interacting CTD phosphatase-like protein